MDEFNLRMESQRIILKIVNKPAMYSEPLSSLNSKAIERWVSANSISPDNSLVELIYEVSNKLFFLANKSQEQITDEYELLKNQVSMLTKRIQEFLKSQNGENSWHRE